MRSNSRPKKQFLVLLLWPFLAGFMSVSLEIFWRWQLGSVDVLSVAIVLLIGVAGLLVVVKRASCVLCIVSCVLRASCLVPCLSSSGLGYVG